jgi:NAD(P)-dependent dehydrogenase (short-subunit alcohol dehydrogenase family)
MKNQVAIIIGANSEIGKGLAEQLITNNQIQLIVISRDTHFYQQERFNSVNVIKVNDYQEKTINLVTSQLKIITDKPITQVFICHGLLHTDSLQPEKRLEDFSPADFSQVISVNTITPMLWLKYLTPILSGKQQCKVVVFSARVGSITDNRLGGW